MQSPAATEMNLNSPDATETEIPFLSSGDWKINEDGVNMDIKSSSGELLTSLARNRH